jgi:hypothetical protein
VRSVSQSVPWINLCLASHTSGKFNLNSHRYRRMQVIQGATHAICEYGVNDLSVSFASVATNLVTTWKLLADRGMKVYQTTITPFTTSTGGFTTTANQTIASGIRSNTVRVSINDWIRAGAPVNATTLAPVAVGTSGALLAG